MNCQCCNHRWHDYRGASACMPKPLDHSKNIECKHSNKEQYTGRETANIVGSDERIGARRQLTRRVNFGIALHRLRFVSNTIAAIRTLWLSGVQITAQWLTTIASGEYRVARSRHGPVVRRGKGLTMGSKTHAPLPNHTVTNTWRNIATSHDSWPSTCRSDQELVEYGYIAVPILAQRKNGIL